MGKINKKYPGKSAQDIYEKVDAMMQGVAEKMGLKYEKDDKAKSGKVSKMGITGNYLASEGEVTVDLSFPMLVPGAMKKQVEESIEKRLDGLFA